MAKIDGLALFKNINGHHADKICKQFYQLFNENGISLEIEYNLKTVNYLDITLDLNSGTYKPYRKLNDETFYIYAKSNHPANILKQLPTSIITRLYNLPSNPEVFHEASKYYQNVLNQSGYEYKLQCKSPNNENENKSKSSKNRKRNIVWFIPPFLKNISNNICKYFLLLIRIHFPNNHKYNKIFNKNNVKISYTFMTSIKSITNMHSKEVITKKKNTSSKL